MAEARSATEVVQQQKRGVQLWHIDDNGLELTFTVSIPSPHILFQILKIHARRLKNSVLYNLAPFHPLVFLAVVTFIAVVVATAAPASWWRSGWLADFVWTIDCYVPWTHMFPVLLRVVYLTIITSVICLMLILALQRLVLRLLFSYRPWMFDPPGHVSRATRVWAAAVKLLSGRRRGMNAYGGTMPALPVPALSATVARYLTTVSPLMDKADFDETAAMARNFLAGEGPKLQRYLTLKSWTSSNYVTDWWEKYVYLRGRTPLMINSNYYILDLELSIPVATQSARAAVVTSSYLQWRELIATEHLPPQLLRGLVPLCMEQHRRAFNTTRIPGRDMDHYDVHTYSSHLAVLCNGKWYRLDVVDRSLRRLTVWELEAQFAAIIAHAHEEAPGSPSTALSDSEAESMLAAFTADDRTTWANVRERFFSDGVNKRSLSAIEKAAFVVVLDDFQSDDYSERARHLFHGTGSNIWFDKSMTLIVDRDGKVGVNGEHGWADAPVLAQIHEAAVFSHFFEHRLDSDGQLVPSPDPQVATLVKALRPPKRLVWSFTDAFKEEIRASFGRARALIDNVDHLIMEFNEFGKGLPKKLGMSPDGFIQMALQLAFFRDQGRFALTYESSLTRLYREGRTETIRSLSEQSAAWVRAMESADATLEEKRALLRDAVEQHQAYYRDAMCGKGIDRHLFALYIVSQGTEIESPFLKNALSIPWRLSTSQQPQEQTGALQSLRKRGDVDTSRLYCPGGGFGPVADCGYGISYMITDETHLYFHISSQLSSEKTSSHRMAGNIGAALRDMRKIFEVK
mmetsp:Transcript_45820/g.115389  ORF Transcript_45820/g.115389 Transcript_45820/m.115389 type:complete len:799 (+) Transcript_45820:296-2692(+)|eukprot:CAMPEP_0177641586 /NCGR_PEP_ID=MMETSP0447-20121125/7143_1 /TAXON_ID=0 /ORGANISM="Stygamoeba regulata, Strain BSH-02190019" /LENGTH=798 /DNA_ID=CAMNT_0019143709 /DNA_START=233 /DNA_END=2629 /DNA_ORIENTATION=+